MSFPASFAGDLQAEAERLGFVLCGIAPAQPAPHHAAFTRWLAQGLHGGMAYLARERDISARADPRRLMENCRSVISLAVRYPAPAQLEIQSGYPFGRIAAYACSTDYHLTLPRRMGTFGDVLRRMTGIGELAIRSYTDSAPILERNFAQLAGMGWIGKNTCLISPRFGSYLLLAELLVTIELPPAEPFPFDRCGTCRRCIEACPTACIRPDRTLDAGRCISYLTIEHKGIIPRELRPKLDSWIFGCDVCQQVCPWNRLSAQQSFDPAFAPRFPPSPDLHGELRLSVQEFRRRYADTPLSRPKRRGYLRNAAVALGNVRNPQDVPLLAEVLQSEPEPLVRAHAAWALGQVGTSAARTALSAARRHEPAPQVREEIALALQAG